VQNWPGSAKEYTYDGVKSWDKPPSQGKGKTRGKNPKKGITLIDGAKVLKVDEPVTLTPWTPPLDEPEPGDYQQMKDNVYRQKRSVSPVKGRVILAVIVPGGINTQEKLPHIMLKPKRERLRKNPKKSPQTTRPSKIVLFTMSNYLEMRSSKW